MSSGQSITVQGLPADMPEGAHATGRAAPTPEPGATPARAQPRPRRWPYVNPPQAQALPETLPDGSPWPRISIVTPSFNQGAYIEETILSVLHQNYPDVEHIVIDGGSSDGTLEILARYRSRLAQCVIEPDHGQGDAINKGFRLATGQILTWLNSDDLLAPGALAAVAMAMHASGADLVAGVCQLFDGDRAINEHLTSCASDQPLPLEDLLDIDGCWNAGQFFYQPEVMFTRAIWDKAGGHVDSALYYSMDYELWLRFAQQQARLHVIGRPVARFRVHAKQKTTDTQRFTSELRAVRDALVERGGCPTVTARAAAPCAARAARSSLRIVMLNDLGFQYGAGIAHGRLAAALHASGHEVIPLAALRRHDGQPDEAVCSDADILAAIEAARPDLVMVGNIHGAGLDVGLLGHIAQRWPTAMEMHDMWAVTGRCAYAGACEKYLSASGCDASCPTAGEYPALAPARIHDALAMRQRIYRADAPVVLLANSRWTAEIARQFLATMDQAMPSLPHTARAATIRLGLPTDVFRPRDPATCRALLGLPEQRFLVLFSASSLADRRKGVDHLVEAMRRLALSDATAVCIGHYDATARPELPDLRMSGYIDDPLRLAMLYSAVDLYVGPSLEEALGQVYFEAGACGTPSVGYPVGGVSEAIRDGITGRVAAAVDPGALADAIGELYDDEALRRRMGRWASIYVHNEWSLPAASHAMHVALHATGLGQRLGLGRKLLFMPERPPMPPVQYVRPASGWRPLSGFGPWEGPYAQWKLPRCRWLHGPTCGLELAPARAGRHRLMISVHHAPPAQRVQLLLDGQPCAAQDVGQIAEGDQYVLGWTLDLPQRVSCGELRFAQWEPPQRNPRPLALLVSRIVLMPWT